MMLGTPSLARELVRLGKLPRFLLPHFVRVLGVSSRHGHVWRKVTGTRFLFIVNSSIHQQCLAL